MIDFIKIYYLVFGALTILGGVIGFAKAKSRASLIAGSITGLALIVSGILVAQGSVVPGLIVGLLVSVALAGQFIPKVMINRAPPHVILMALLSAVSLVLTLISFARK